MSKLLATYPNEQAARAAVRRLRSGGIPTDDIYMNASTDDRIVAKAEMGDEVSHAVFGPGVVATNATKKAAIGGTLIGVAIGGVLGLAIGLAFFWGRPLGIFACIIGLGVAGWVAMALWSMYAAAEEEQESTEHQLETQVIVGVHSDDRDEIKRAEDILQRTDPQRLDLAS
jgi:predicted lipid-binding transport protein (Tim44 family)